MADDNGPKIEFNSMVEVLKRLSIITQRINETRFQRTKASMGDMICLMCEYYKEISVDLDKNEREIWKDLQELQKKVMSKTPSTADWCMWKKIDDVDLLLRQAAKRHGYLTKQAKDSSLALVN